MSPRPYRLGQRQASTEQTRTRIITAARELLMTSTGFSGFSIDAVARQADVARMTVYHQFGSKIGLLEALFDSVATSGGMEQLATAFRRPEPLDALAEYITVFSRFWDSDRLVTRRIHGLAALYPDFEQVVRAREERRRQGLRDFSVSVNTEGVTMTLASVARLKFDHCQSESRSSEVVSRREAVL